MIDEEELIHALSLQKAKGIGPINARKLLLTYGSALAIKLDKKNSLEKLRGVQQGLLKQIFSSKNLQKSQLELEAIKKNNIEVIYLLSEAYPKLLKNCPDAPILLFKDGAIDFNEPLISIIGTRRMTAYGEQFCNDLIKKIAPYNPTIVSGFAYGVDICAQKAALKNNLQTIAVYAHGFDHVYPKTHKKYVSEIVKKGGFLTEFWHQESPLRENFLKRNRIIAGISEATIIIESAEKGGALYTASLADSYNRSVFALPGRNTDSYSVGCNMLIKNNLACMITSPDDIIKHLNWDLKKMPQESQQKLFEALTNKEQAVYDFLLKNGKNQIDVIAQYHEIPIQRTMAILFEMELKGVVRPIAGKLYEAI